MKALDRTDFGAVGVFTLDAVFGNNVGHELVTFFTERFRGAGVAGSLAGEAVVLDAVVFFAAGVLALAGFFAAGFLVLLAADLRTGAAFLAGGVRFSRGGGGV